ncbi:hypothetical protein R3W88_031617 [Solanum pinnatisectum]|uniref:Retrotransposon gag domain-containing protein n=1 Tax=Solanum pinnatisectum TaxID=50273 RepID=A0AAV9LLU8_9SOLN|nr:hypothetical protein R3W88_031617 [Solanum pinnatisectum]
MVLECQPHQGCRLDDFLLIRAYECFQIIMPPRKAVRGRPARRNVEEQELPNAPIVQHQGKDAPSASWACFEEAFLGHFFPRELKKAKVREFLTLKQDSLSVHEYGLNFTQLSRYAPKMVVDMRSKMSLFVVGLAHLSSKEGRATMLIGDMDISRLMVYVQQVEVEKLRDREEFKNKRKKDRERVRTTEE